MPTESAVQKLPEPSVYCQILNIFSFMKEKARQLCCSWPRNQAEKDPVSQEAFSFLVRIWNAVICRYSLTKRAQTSTNSHQWQWPFIVSFGTKKMWTDWDYPRGMFVSWDSDSAWIKRGKKIHSPSSQNSDILYVFTISSGLKDTVKLLCHSPNLAVPFLDFCNICSLFLSWTQVHHQGSVSF